jgi:hypothetical protein
MAAEFKQLTINQSTVMRVAHLKAFLTAKIGITGMVTGILQVTVKMIVQQILNLINSNIVALRIRKAQSSGILVLHQMFSN